MIIYHIAPAACMYKFNEMPSIKAVYQMEQEFAPYLEVKFLPKSYDKYSHGIILQANDNFIYRPYTFNNTTDIDNLRDLIWSQLVKTHKITNIADNKGCLHNFYQQNPNIVVQGYPAARQLHIDHCNAIDRNLTNPPRKLKPLDPRIMHEVFRLNTSNDNIGIHNCQRVHSQECKDNFPPHTWMHEMCLNEVAKQCDNTYSQLNINAFVDRVRYDLYQRLRQLSPGIDWILVRNISSNTLLSQIQDVVGAKIPNYDMILDGLVDVYSRDHDRLYDYDRFERFDGFDGFDDSTSNYYIICAIIIVIVLSLIYYSR